ncbi:MAG: Asp-tRNA(Asn)/Glu-tRNA(Gln) amidotransferase subunit GatC [Candidatus Eisenbacteria sp.]|nr:Asp-tRNA(Asn)/Glu-tRNA(Gln) amidotransferase subunit GatC [Candidatus Eisenbacteria bacterium]
MEISEKQIAHLCELARLDLPPEELKGLLGDLRGILRYMQLLACVETTGVDPMLPSVGLAGSLRDDQPAPGTGVQDALRGAPERCGNFFAVPAAVPVTPAQRAAEPKGGSTRKIHGRDLNAHAAGDH